MTTTTATTTHTVEVWLSQDTRETMCDGYRFDVEYRLAHTLTVDDEHTPHGIAEVAFAVCNSYPDEMHCASAYTADVQTYRDNGNRSLSVGDYVVVDGVKLAVARFGFEEVAS